MKKNIFSTISHIAAGAATWATLHSYVSTYLNKANQEKTVQNIENMRNTLENINKLTEENINNNKKITEDSVNIFINLKEQFNKSINGTFNSFNNIKDINSLIKNKDLNSEGKNKILNELDSHLNNIQSELEQGKSILNQIEELVSKFSNSGSGSNLNFINLNNIINQYNEFLSTLSVTQLGALGHLLGAILIFSCLISILAIFYGDLLINYLKLEEKYPKIARFIQIRRKFQQYYLLLNICFIVLVLFLIIYVNLIILLN